MKHPYLLLLICLLNVWVSNAQQWSGGTTSSVPIWRLGPVTIGTDSVRAVDRALDVNGHVVIAGATASDMIDFVNTHEAMENGADALWIAIRKPQPYNPGILTLSSVYPNNAEAMWDVKFTVRNNGNVGIGTNFPTKLVDIKGKIQMYEGLNGDPTITMNNSGLNRFGASGNLGFWTDGQQDVNNSPQMFIGNNGNVGIGTTTPTAKLAVNGVVKAKEIKVSLSGYDWPDYVFNPSYKLPTLSETAQYIRENGHLPNMPTAIEVEKEGVRLGEMNKKLLEKVEELTLQVIMLSKQVEKQQEVLNRIKKGYR